jgi:hypothetical protein
VSRIAPRRAGPATPGSGAAPAAMAGLWALFLVSAAALGYEIALTRYFAVAKWSEYGYWVISIVMVGFAFSGVTLALARDAFVRHGALLQAALPAALVVAAALGYHLTTTNPFNPLALQNPVTWAPQLWNIAGYYAALLPFFFLTGLFVSLSFVLNPDRVGRVYGFDLTGAGLGAAVVLVLMRLLHPFDLVPAMLVPLAAAAFFVRGRRRLPAVLAALAALLAGEALLLLDNQARFNDFKAIYAPLNTPGARIVAEARSPRGFYQLLDDFTERVDTDISNDLGLLGVDGPPQTFGLYRDGNRIAALPKPGPLDVSYATAALDGLPYTLVPHARVLLAGASGGFRIAEALRLGAAQVDAVEPERLLRGALRHGFGPSPAPPADAHVRILAGPPLAVLDHGPYGIIDISADFLDATAANTTAFSVEALRGYLGALEPGGMVSIPVSIREFPVYALRMLATARAALLAAGVHDPARHVVVYRSAWSVRILISPTPWSAARIAAVKKFCDDRSFDVSFYAGMDVAAARPNIYNDLPSVSFDSGEVVGQSPDDSIADEAAAVLAGEASPSSEAFRLTPVTLDRPFFYNVLRLERLGTILKRLEVLPQQEIGPLVNLAVLAQAIVIALLVLVVPLLSPRRIAAGAGAVRAGAYFAALGLGFLCIEIYMIEKAAFWLDDRTTAFALVLTGMLIFSGFGSMISARLEAAPRRTMVIAAIVALAWCALALFGLQPLMLATLTLPDAVRWALVLIVVAPVSLALGMPFPLGLAQIARDRHGGFLPWAWALNGAFSVVATPLANLLALESGFHAVLILAGLVYVVAMIAFPLKREAMQWQDIPAPSHAAD